MQLTEVSFARLLYRYLFFGWLFRDVQRGTWLEREAALRHNQERSVWLPTYMRRWTVLGLGLYGVGVALEAVGHEATAPVAYVAACIAAPVIAVALAGWVLLKRAPSAARPESPSS
jgi:hypothetical protein